MTPDDPMRVGDEDFRTPSQMFADSMRDFDYIFSGRKLPPETPAQAAAREAYWEARKEWEERPGQ